MHPETAVDSATATTICQNGEERVLVNVVVTFAEAFRAVLVGSAEAVVVRMLSSLIVHFVIQA